VPKNFEATEEEARLLNDFGDDGLTPGHIMWRRNKISELSTPLVDGEKKFRQEYPCDVHEAFQVTGEGGFISQEAVKRARTARVPKGGVLVVGVDPSRGGDRFAVIRRAGRRMYGPETYSGEINLGLAVRICKRVLDEERPARMFIDAGGGADLVDRLHELGYFHAVKAGLWTAGDTWAYYRAGKDDALRISYWGSYREHEMWGEMAYWLDQEDIEVQIPDSDELQADLCTPTCSWDSSERMLIESKEHIKNVRRLPSPDLGDAAALTFAENMAAISEPSAVWDDDSGNLQVEYGFQPMPYDYFEPDMNWDDFP